MASVPGTFIAWFFLTAVVVAIDATYVLTRASTHAADTRHPYRDTFPLKYWTIYEQYDRRYLANDDVWNPIQAWLNVAEALLGLVVVLLSVAGAPRAALKLAIIVSMMTLYKTVVYLCIDAGEGHLYTKHNSQKDLITMIYLPFAAWVVIPAWIIKRSFAELDRPHRGGASPAQRKSVAQAPNPKKSTKAKR